MFLGPSSWSQGWAGPLYPLEHSIGQAIRLSAVLIYGAVSLFCLQPSSACEGIRESRYLELRGTAQVAVHGQNPTTHILLFMFSPTIQSADIPPLSRGFLPIVKGLRPEASVRNSSISKGELHMTIIQWLPQTLGRIGEWFKPITRKFVTIHTELEVYERTKKVFYSALIVGIVIGISLPLTAWTADLSSREQVKPRAVVAAGIGYENAETSKLSVKTYDAESGVILTDETFELDVREDAASLDNAPRERIFAGGVGPGDDGLSSFTLRAYDAATGMFLWEGLLNLTAGNHEAGSPYQVVAHLVTPQVTVTRIRNQETVDGQPQFFLRAVDQATGQLAWTDHFSAGVGAFARTEHVNRAVVGQTEELATSSQQIEFRIRMMDNQGRQVKWEDTIKPAVEETDMAARHDAAADTLPVWVGEEADEMKRESI